MSKKQTAVEWLLNQIDLETISKYDKQFVQAKAMEKEQMIKFVNDYLDDDADLTAEQFYYETYESKGSDGHLPDVREMVEISDEEITKLANEYILYNDSKRQWVIEGMKLYREHLKNK